MNAIQSYIKAIPDFPKPGIVFRDITTLFGDRTGFALAVKSLLEETAPYEPEYIAGLEARGFILGGALAQSLNAGFIPIRKEGKLPRETFSQSYELEYGSATLAIHKDACEAGARVVLHDDLIATGGSAVAGIKLLEALGAKVVAANFVIDLPALGGRERLEEMGIKTSALCQFD